VSSIRTKVGAASALQSSNSTNRSLAAAQNRTGVGLGVESAKNNSSPRAITAAMRGDVSRLKAISANLALSISAISAACEGAETVSSLLDKIKEKVVQASGTGVDTARIQDSVDRLIMQIDGVTNAAEFNGINLLNGSTAGRDLPAAMDRSSGSPAAQTITVNGSDLTTATLGIGSLEVTSPTALDDIETAVGAAVSAAAEFGSVRNRLAIQSDFIRALTEALDEDAGGVVDANMNEEAARLSALQAQQRLGIRSLSIANSAPKSILALFR